MTDKEYLYFDLEEAVEAFFDDYFIDEKDASYRTSIDLTEEEELYLQQVEDKIVEMYPEVKLKKYSVLSWFLWAGAKSAKMPVNKDDYKKFKKDIDPFFEDHYRELRKMSDYLGSVGIIYSPEALLDWAIRQFFLNKNDFYSDIFDREAFE